MSKRIDLNIEKEVVRLYTTITQNGWIGKNDISKRLGISATAVDIILERNGVKKRSIKEAYEFGKRSKPIKNIPIGDAPLCKCNCQEKVSWNRRKNSWNAYVEGHYRREHPYKNFAWFKDQYESGKTVKDIAAQFGVSSSAVSKYIKKFSIKLRSHSDTLKNLGLMVGKKNPAWKGGTTPERQRIYKTETWAELVKYIYKRDGYKCQRCGTEKIGSVKFHAHHIHPWALYPDLRLEQSNLITLCDTCHRWVHSKQNVNLDYLAK